MAQLTVARRLFPIGVANVWRGLIAGFVATVAMTLLTYMAPLMGFPPMDIPTMLGTMLFAPAVAFWPGLAMHFMIGLVLALGYALFLANILPGQPWLRGALYGLVPWLMAMVVVMPMLGLVHPMVSAGMMPNPGFFLTGMGTVLAPIGSLVGHLVYGAVLGLVYGRPKAS